MQHPTETSETLENIRLQHALSANPGRRVGGRSSAQRDLTLGRGGEGGWSCDATEEVGPGTEMVTESTRGPPRGCGVKEAWWEESAKGAESAVSRSGDGTQRKGIGSAGSAVSAGIAAMRDKERSISWSGQ